MSLKARILVGFVGAVGTLLAAILFFYAASPYVERGVVPFFHSAPLEALIFGTAGIACLFVSIRLIAGRRWAWWATALINTLVLGTGLILLWIVLHPRDEFARSEGGFGFFLSILTIAPSAFCLAVLFLPVVRRSFFRGALEETVRP
jgi:hypothetical protein